MYDRAHFFGLVVRSLSGRRQHPVIRLDCRHLQRIRVVTHMFCVGVGCMLELFAIVALFLLAPILSTIQASTVGQMEIATTQSAINSRGNCWIMTCSFQARHYFLSYTASDSAPIYATYTRRHESIMPHERYLAVEVYTKIYIYKKINNNEPVSTSPKRSIRRINFEEAQVNVSSRVSPFVRTLSKFLLKYCSISPLTKFYQQTSLFCNDGILEPLNIFGLLRINRTFHNNREGKRRI